MTSEEFVQEFVHLKKFLEGGYFDPSSDISRVSVLKDAKLTEAQIDVVKTFVSAALTDALYTVLLGLDGAASIGTNQVLYRLCDEGQNLLSGNIESYAWEYFHGDHA